MEISLRETLKKVSSLHELQSNSGKSRPNPFQKTLIWVNYNKKSPGNQLVPAESYDGKMYDFMESLDVKMLEYVKCYEMCLF